MIEDMATGCCRPDGPSVNEIDGNGDGDGDGDGNGGGEEGVAVARCSGC
jgi:hypothetical protein